MLWVHLHTVFSFQVYQRLLFTTRKQRVLFVIYLWLLSLGIVYLAAGTQVRRQLPALLKNFPQVTFEKGTLTEPSAPLEASLAEGMNVLFNPALTQPPTAAEMTRKGQQIIVGKNTLYVMGAAGVQQMPLPPEFSFVTSQENLAKIQPAVGAVLRLGTCMMAAFFIPFVLLFGWCVAYIVGEIFNALRPKRVPAAAVRCWALFLLGPLSVLWYVRLWVPIPLFGTAQTILCIIYMQQIFNRIGDPR